MQLSITGKQVDVGDALRSHVEDGLGTTVSKYFDNALEAAVVFSRNGQRFHTDISVHVGRGILLQGKADAEDPYHAFDLATAHIGKRLRRYKRRIRDHHKVGERATETVSAQQYILADEPHGEGAGDHDGEHEHVVVAEMTTEIPMLKVSEAVMRMNLADLPAMMFRNSAHGGLNMIYRRPDGNIGWVDPRGTRENTQ